MSKIGAPSKGDYLGGGGKGHFLHRSKIPRRLCVFSDAPVFVIVHHYSVV